MSELKFILLMEILTLHLDCSIEPFAKKNGKKWKTKILWAKKTSFFAPLPFSPWAILATWLHVGVPYKIQEK